MILYNMRNRGPYEYDKFTLNILQIYNAVTLSEMHELKANKESKEALLVLQKEVNDLYDELIGTSSKMGLCEKLFLNSYKIKED